MSATIASIVSLALGSLSGLPSPSRSVSSTYAAVIARASASLGTPCSRAAS